MIIAGVPCAAPVFKTTTTKEEFIELAKLAYWSEKALLEVTANSGPERLNVNFYNNCDHYVNVKKLEWQNNQAQTKLCGAMTMPPEGGFDHWYD